MRIHSIPIRCLHTNYLFVCLAPASKSFVAFARRSPLRLRSAASYFEAGPSPAKQVLPVQPPIFSHCKMPYCALMRYYQPFPAAIPLDGPGYPHVTHPSATKYTQDSLYASTSIISAYTPFDLHVLGTPPAFILSQDRTLVFYLRISSMLLFFPSRTSLPVSGKGAVLPLSFFCVSLCPSFTAFWFKELSSLCFLSKLRCCLVFKVPFAAP